MNPLAFGVVCPPGGHMPPPPLEWPVLWLSETPRRVIDKGGYIRGKHDFYCFWQQMCRFCLKPHLGRGMQPNRANKGGNWGARHFRPSLHKGLENLPQILSWGQTSTFFSQNSTFQCFDLKKRRVFPLQKNGVSHATRTQCKHKECMGVVFFTRPKAQDKNIEIILLCVMEYLFLFLGKFPCVWGQETFHPINSWNVF